MASGEVSFSETDAVERSVERSVALSEKVSLSSSSYQWRVGNAMVSSYEPSSALRKFVEELDANPEGRIEEFLATWGYGFVSEVVSSFEVFSTCNKDAEESLDAAAERCRETGAKFKVEVFGAGACAGGSTTRCDMRGLSDSQKKTLPSISRVSARANRREQSLRRDRLDEYAQDEPIPAEDTLSGRVYHDGIQYLLAHHP
ncbi:hypothetical protein Q5P01_020014 [Channa striata]|uniref:Uncharacterized protein n=1 Tax=Channa striata TaxID=64152 RepID=A0AA88LXI7_CHASR|nr:hypothetical protein Q5P01_020014 [Channa striata]